MVKGGEEVGKGQFLLQMSYNTMKKKEIGHDRKKKHALPNDSARDKTTGVCMHMPRVRVCVYGQWSLAKA